MKVLVFALLALAVSADNYGYGQDYGSSWSSSYPISYGGGYGSSLYGGGYGSSLYGASYGSGIGYDIGGGSYSAGYAPTVYKTAKYPQGNVAAYHGEGYRYSMAEEPVKIVLAEEFSGIDGHSDYQLGTPEVQTYGVPQPIIAHEVLSNYKNEDSSKMAFIPDTPRFDELPNYRPVVFDKFPVTSQKSDFSTIGGRSQATFTRDFPKVTLKTAVTDRKPAIQAVNKVINPRIAQKQQTTGYVHRTSPVYKSKGPEYSTRVHPQISFVLGGVDILQPGYKPNVPSFAPKPTYVRSGSVGYVPKNTAQSFSSRSGPSRITFTRDFSKISNQQPVRKPETSNFGNVGAPVFPGVIPSGGYLGQRSKTSFVSPPKPVQKPISQEQDFAAIEELPPYSADYTRENENPRYVLVPETTFTNDKSSADYPTTSDINSEYEKPFPLKYYAESGGNVQDLSSGHGIGSRSYNILPGRAEEDRPTFYEGVPEEDHGDDKSSVPFHSADISAPAGSLVEEKRPSYLTSPIRSLGKHAAASVKPNHEPQLPIS